MNNAGVAVRKNTLTLTEAEWDLVIDTNVKSVFLVSQAIGKHMARRKYGYEVRERAREMDGRGEG